MSRTSQAFLFICVALAALAAGLLLYSSNQEQLGATPPSSAQKLLDATLPDLSGQSQGLGQWKGKVLVVNFWATWCAPCREEIPALMRVQAKLAGRGVQIVGIAVDQADQVRPYAAELGINYPVLVGELDAIDLARQAGNELGGLPFTVIIDRAGQPVGSHLGELDQERLERIVQPLL